MAHHHRPRRLVAHFCLTTALKLAPATVVMPVDFTRLPLIAVIGMVLYGEALDIYVFIGAAVIFAANYTNIWLESRARAHDTPHGPPRPGRQFCVISDTLPRTAAT